MELSTSSISNEIEKSVQEEFSVSQAAIDEIRRRREKGQKPESISNEQIKKRSIYVPIFLCFFVEKVSERSLLSELSGLTSQTLQLFIS